MVLGVMKKNKETQESVLLSIDEFFESKPFGLKVSLYTIKQLLKGSWYQDSKHGYYLQEKF